MTVLEAMALGIPTVTSDYGAMPEVVDHGEAGMSVRRGDADQLASALLRLLEPTANGDARRRTAASFDARYSPAAATAELARGYRQALALGPPSRSRP
jgi:glycosyltransferase involved in cell wall biosynthesis